MNLLLHGKSRRVYYRTYFKYNFYKPEADEPSIDFKTLADGELEIVFKESHPITINGEFTLTLTIKQSEMLILAYLATVEKKKRRRILDRLRRLPTEEQFRKERWASLFNRKSK